LKEKLPPTDRTLRNTTLDRVVEAEALRKKAVEKKHKRKQARIKKKGNKEKKIILTQEDLLKEAEVTEQLNKESLLVLSQLEEEKKKIISEKPRINGPIIRFYSKNGKNSITFTDVDKYPDFINCNEHNDYNGLELTKRSKCSITNLPAQFVDPKTGYSYANLEAFKALRNRHLKNEDAKHDHRLSQLNSFIQETKKSEETVKRFKFKDKSNDDFVLDSLDTSLP
jgi:hypothetical protein